MKSVIILIELWLDISEFPFFDIELLSHDEIVDSIPGKNQKDDRNADHHNGAPMDKIVSNMNVKDQVSKRKPKQNQG